MANGFTLNVWVCKRRLVGGLSGGARHAGKSWERINMCLSLRHRIFTVHMGILFGTVHRYGTVHR